ncbi:universal stress protein [Streptomyces anthocyanicus]|uniref:universal stress protein n=1 Tax=Streptomyces TaxID=1883 RepID=UPI0037F199B3
MLVAQALSAAAVVVGHRGPHPFQGALIGSLATGLAAHSECPVVVVGEPENPAGPVALGVDGSAAGAAAVRFAFRETSVQGADITAVHAWTAWNAPMPPPPDERPSPTPVNPACSPRRKGGYWPRRSRACAPALAR